MIFLSTTDPSWCPRLNPRPPDLLCVIYKFCRHTVLYCPNPNSPNSNSSTGDLYTRGLAAIQQRERERERVHWLISFPFWLGSSNDVMLLVFRPPPTLCLPTPRFCPSLPSSSHFSLSFPPQLSPASLYSLLAGWSHCKLWVDTAAKNFWT